MPGALQSVPSGATYRIKSKVPTFKSKLGSAVGTSPRRASPTTRRAYEYNIARPLLPEVWKECLRNFDNTKEIGIELCQLLFVTWRLG
jgi:hypothetical protein